MKQNKNELDVDYIGGSGSLTKEEEKAISAFIKFSKERRQKQKVRQKAQTAKASIDASAKFIEFPPATMLKKRRSRDQNY